MSSWNLTIVISFNPLEPEICENYVLKKCVCASQKTPCIFTTKCNQLMLSEVIHILVTRKYSKAVPMQAWTGPEGSRRLRLPGICDSRHLRVVWLSALRTGRLYPHGRFLVIISVTSWVDSRPILLPEGLGKWKTWNTSLGFETATFRFVA
jgi:hypothetical protein